MRRKGKMEVPEVIPVCYCGNPAKLTTSWSNDNPRRRFFGCKKFGSRFRKPCRFFSWFDPPLTPRSRVVLLGSFLLTLIGLPGGLLSGGGSIGSMFYKEVHCLGPLTGLTKFE
ncbi:hypothetical protein J1N35_034894 [Gossypium stocksii]|uniref:GRF-type domain-containing protein n=1 Tax=Gossypium stocksii TaxID=47602 RepID=A0A9D3ZQF6_9ROSI|nr:hypothetical protein J1N35_034894 [Gossypium stocksii]